MPERIIGRRPKPRALIVGFDDELAEHLKALFPTDRVISHINDVHQEESDVLVTTQSLYGVSSRLFVLGMGSRGQGLVESSRLGRYDFGPFHTRSHQSPSRPQASKSVVLWKGSSKATEFRIPGGLSPAMERLVEGSLLPLARSREDHLWLEPNQSTVEELASWRDAFSPFLLTADGKPLAGNFLRAGGKTECWCFPEYAEELTPLVVEVALEEWAKIDPSTFPSAVWTSQRPWRTADENRLATELEKVEAEHSAILARLEGRRQELENKLTMANKSAAARERLLLTVRVMDLYTLQLSVFRRSGLK